MTGATTIRLPSAGHIAPGTVEKLVADIASAPVSAKAGYMALYPQLAKK